MKFSEIAVFFSTMAVVTFGGAYSVLTYIAQEVRDQAGLRKFPCHRHRQGKQQVQPRRGAQDREIESLAHRITALERLSERVSRLEVVSRSGS